MAENAARPDASNRATVVRNTRGRHRPQARRDLRRGARRAVRVLHGVPPALPLDRLDAAVQGRRVRDAAPAGHHQQALGAGRDRAAGARPRPPRQGPLHGAGGGRRIRDRGNRRHRDRRRVPLLEPDAARLPALRRRLADGADPRDRADGRDLARRPGPAGLDAGRRDQRLPHVLPRRDQHAARPRLDRSPQARADALLRRLGVEHAVARQVPVRAPVSLLGVQGGRDGERRRRDHRRAAVVDPGRPRRRDSQLRPVLLARSRRRSGRRTSSRPPSASSSSPSSRSPSVSSSGGLRRTSHDRRRRGLDPRTSRRRSARVARRRCRASTSSSSPGSSSR